jgi:toxin secretion/phage lysis holin
MTALKLAALSAVSVTAAAITSLLGGWDAGIQSLLLFMALDYATGLIVAGVFKTSRKTAQGALESRVAFKGLLRKGASLGVILIACRLDRLLGTTLVRDATVIAYCGSELLSLTENLGLMGVPLPRAVTNAIETLKGSEESK